MVVLVVGGEGEAAGLVGTWSEQVVSPGISTIQTISSDSYQNGVCIDVAPFSADHIQVICFDVFEH